MKSLQEELLMRKFLDREIQRINASLDRRPAAAGGSAQVR